MKTLHRFLAPSVAIAGALLAAAITTRAAVSVQTLPTHAMRARVALHHDIFSRDGERVGDVYDYVLQFTSPPQLRYVIVKTGGVAGVGGEERAIPADAVTFAGNRFEVNLTHAAFGQLPVLPQHRRTFFDNAANLTDLAKRCGTPAQHAALAEGYVLFSHLSNDDVMVGTNSEDLGHFRDIWIDFNANEAPYLEFVATSEELVLRGDVSFDIPTTKIIRLESNRIYFATSEDEIANAKSVTDVVAYVAKAGDELEILQQKVVR